MCLIELVIVNDIAFLKAMVGPTLVIYKLICILYGI